MPEIWRYAAIFAGSFRSTRLRGIRLAQTRKTNRTDHDEQEHDGHEGRAASCTLAGARATSVGKPLSAARSSCFRFSYKTSRTSCSIFIGIELDTSIYCTLCYPLWSTSEVRNV